MSNVQVSEINGLKIYNLTGGKSLFDMMKESNFNYKKLKKNEDYVNRIEIIQDFQFPISAGCLKVSNDGNYIISGGIYPPRLKIYELNEMSLKCERGLDSEIRKIEIISDDYSKIATLCEDRNIELHAQYGKHFKIRIPKYGRDLAYHSTSCDLFAVGSTNEIYRLNLFEGQFLNPFQSNCESINSCAINYNLEVLGVAGEKGVVELWDLKDKKRIVGLPILQESLYNNYDFSDATAINFSNDGLLMSVGNAAGKVCVYDIRNPKPMYTINHSYRLPIKKIKFHEHSQNIITVDKKLAKFSNMKTGKAFTNIETKHDINDFETFKDSGMFFFATESEKMDIYFVPGIGPAPKWASFLENITEELEEAKTYSVYEDYKFLTYTELEQLGATNLIGTNFIKPYMHGYFMDWKLYKKLKSVSDPFAYDKYLEERKQEKFNKLFGERIVFRNKKTKVNSKLLEEAENTDNKDDTGLLQNVVNDSRFEKLFKDKNFEIDFKSEHFKNSKAASGKVKNKNQSALKEEYDDIKFLDDEEEKTKLNKTEKVEKIVNPELIKLKEKLLSKKRKKIENLYGNTEEELEKSLQKRVKDDEVEEDDHVLESRISKIERKIKSNEEYRKKIKPKITSKKLEGVEGKRLLASSDKLTLTKFR